MACGLCLRIEGGIEHQVQPVLFLPRHRDIDNRDQGAQVVGKRAWSFAVVTSSAPSLVALSASKGFHGHDSGGDRRTDGDQEVRTTRNRAWQKICPVGRFPRTRRPVGIVALPRPHPAPVWLPKLAIRRASRRRCRIDPRLGRRRHRRARGLRQPVRATGRRGGDGDCRIRSRHRQRQKRVFRHARVLNPSSRTIAPAPDSTAARAPAARSRAIQVGAAAASNSGSSPTARASWRPGSTCNGPRSRPPWPRLSRCGRRPRAVNRLAMAIATGVLPAPPATRLPTQTTGTGARHGFAARRRRALRTPYKLEIGASRVGITPPNCQNVGAFNPVAWEGRA